MGMVFGVVAMFGSVILLSQTLHQTLKQMTSEAPEGSHEQVLQVVVSVRFQRPPSKKENSQTSLNNIPNVMDFSGMIPD